MKSYMVVFKSKNIENSFVVDISEDRRVHQLEEEITNVAIRKARELAKYNERFMLSGVYEIPPELIMLRRIFEQEQNRLYNESSKEATDGLGSKEKEEEKDKIPKLQQEDQESSNEREENKIEREEEEKAGLQNQEGICDGEGSGEGGALGNNG